MVDELSHVGSGGGVEGGVADDQSVHIPNTVHVAGRVVDVVRGASRLGPCKSGG